MFAPVIAMLFIANAALPVLLIVKACPALAVFITWLPKVRLDGAMLLLRGPVGPPV